MIKAVLFDFDGTLSNRIPSAYIKFRELFEKYFPTMDPESLEFEALVQDMMTYDQYGTVTKKVSFGLLRDKYHFDEAQVDAMTEEWAKTFYTTQVLYKNTIRVLTALRKKGYRLGCVTNGSSFSQNKKLDSTGIREYFDVSIVSGDVGVHKPDPAIFLEAARQLGVEPSACVFVGDTISTDILGASKAGMTPIWFWTDPYRPCQYPVKRIFHIEQLLPALEEIEKSENA